jgi:hypothetical protein
MSRSDWRPATQAWRQPWQLLGWPALVGGALLLAAAALSWAVTPRWQAQADTAAQVARAARIAAADARRQASQPVPVAPPAWPSPDQNEARVQALLRLAREQGVQVLGLKQKERSAHDAPRPAVARVADAAPAAPAARRSEGATANETIGNRADGLNGSRGMNAMVPLGADGAPQWLELSLPLRAPYAALRRFMAAALAADPALALEAVRLARGEAQSGLVQAELTFALASSNSPNQPLPLGVAQAGPAGPDTYSLALFTTATATATATAAAAVAAARARP